MEVTNDERNAVPENLKLIFEVQFKFVFAGNDKEIKEFEKEEEEEEVRCFDTVHECLCEFCVWRD